MKRFLLPLLIVAAAPPANVTMQNGAPRAVTPSALVDGSGSQLGTSDNPLYVSGGTGGGGGSTANQRVNAQSGDFVTGAIVDLGTASAPATGTTNARLEQLRALLASPLAVTQSGSWSFTQTAVTGTPGSTAPTSNLLVGGTDGTADRTLLTGSTGALLIGGSGSGSTAALVTAADADTNTRVGLLTGSRGSVYNGTSWDRQRGDTTGTYVVNTPSASANNSLTSATIAGATSNVLKNTAGNVYSLNLVNSTVAGFIVLYDATAAPASGTTLTTGLIRYCFPVAAGAGFDKVFNLPMQMASGAVELFSTSCTVYTPVGTAPVILTGQVK